MNHDNMKLYNGDCLIEMAKIPDGSVDTIITDPPYGIDFQSAWRTDRTQWKPKIQNDKEPFTAWTDEAFRVLKDGCGLLCFTRWDTEQEFRNTLSASGFTCKQQVIWDKVVHGMGDLTGDFASQHENIIFATKGRFVFKGKRPKSIFQVMRVTPESLKHPNEKPVKLIQDLIAAVSVEGDVVLDMFMGAGTSGVACVNMGRDFIGIELDKGYFDIASKRIEEAKGLF